MSMFLRGIARMVSRNPIVGMFNKMPSFTMTPIREMANYRHKKMLKLAKGYRGRANRCYTVALQRVTKARQYAYRDRKVRKLST